METIKSMYREMVQNYLGNNIPVDPVLIDK